MSPCRLAALAAFLLLASPCLAQTSNASANANAGAAASANAGAEAASQAYAGGSTSAAIFHDKRQAPGLGGLGGAAGMLSCRSPIGASGAGPGFGISIFGTSGDEECERRAWSAYLTGSRNRMAQQLGWAIALRSHYVQEAMGDLGINPAQAVYGGGRQAVAARRAACARTMPGNPGLCLD